MLEMLVFNDPVLVAMFPIEAESRPALIDFKALQSRLLPPDDSLVCTQQNRKFETRLGYKRPYLKMMMMMMMIHVCRHKHTVPVTRGSSETERLLEFMDNIVRPNSIKREKKGKEMDEGKKEILQAIPSQNVNHSSVVNAPSLLVQLDVKDGVYPPSATACCTLLPVSGK
ncbi:hypothetical protein STEG23_002652, partial [Scotinomys teguina]